MSDSTFLNIEGDTSTSQEVTGAYLNEEIWGKGGKALEPGFDPGVDPDGPMVIILATGSEVHGFIPGRGRWIF